jgi:transcription elongation GreA/GreB family factor
MSSTHDHHQTLRNFLANRQWDDAQALWLDLADQLPDQPDFLLILIKEVADAGQPAIAAELASLLTPSLKSAGKHHEWLYALKLQAAATPNDKALRAEVIEAYRQIYQTDARLKPILAVSEIERAPLPAAIARADTLLALAVGNFCQHKSWGIGRVKTFDTALNRVMLAFPHNPEHAMQLNYAADSLLPLSADHIEVRKQTDLAGLKQLDPVALVRLVLVSYNHAASADRLEAVLSPAVVPDWKKWWDNTKKLLKRDNHFELPAKKTEPIILRSAPVSQQDDLLENFRVAPSLGQRTDVARQFLKLVADIADPDLLLQEFQDGLLESLKKTRPDRYAERLEAAFVLEDLGTHQKTPTAASLVIEILAGIKNLPAALDDLSAASQKRALAALKTSEPQRLIKFVNDLPAKMLDDIADLLPSTADRLAQLVQNQTASPDLLVWLCRNVTTRDWLAPLQSPVLLQTVLAALQTSSASDIRRMRAVLFDEETLLVDLLANAGTDVVRDVARQILANPGLDELDRRSLMARVLKEFPFVQDFLITKTVKEAPLIVSWASLHKRRAELDEIITKRIPENSKEIGVARSYGDLRENFEFKAAKDTQKVLMRRRAELEILLSRTQPTDFADTKTEVVGIGTSVTVTDLAAGQTNTYHVLGAWDSDPARGIISYPAALAQSLFNKKAGDTVEAQSDTGTVKLRIDRIEKAPAAILQSL